LAEFGLSTEDGTVDIKTNNLFHIPVSTWGDEMVWKLLRQRYGI